MLLERAGVKPLPNPSEKQLRRSLRYVRGTFAALTATDGAYIQVAGWLAQFCLERRDVDGRHFRAFQEQVVVPWKRPVSIR